MSDIRLCDYEGCAEVARAQCECCRPGNWFCDDHGSVGGDIVQTGYADGYRPAACWKCGGFNADKS